MDRKTLNHSLQRLFKAHQAEGRYQGIVLSVPNETDYDILRGQVEAICLEDDIWRQTGLNGAPEIPCHRREFSTQVFSPRERGLVICKPEEWMLDWSELDQANFWNELADAFGRHNILTVVVATPAMIKLMRVNFIEYPLPGLPLSVWLSRHQPVDHLKELLQ